MRATKSRSGEGAAVVTARDHADLTTRTCCTVADAEHLLDVITLDSIDDLDLAALVMPAAKHLADIRFAA